jgi:hypothetical protein
MQAFTLDEATHQHLQNRLGWLSPYYLEKLCLEIKPASQAVTNEEIDQACERLLLHPKNQVFSGWSDHLERNIPDDIRSICKVLLKILSEHKEGESLDSLRIECQPEFTEEKIKEALLILQNDGFIHQQPATHQYGFVMQLLADYWQKYQ